jgi:hypothetical protein
VHVEGVSENDHDENKEKLLECVSLHVDSCICVFDTVLVEDRYEEIVGVTEGDSDRDCVIDGVGENMIDSECDGVDVQACERVKLWEVDGENEWLVDR